MLRLVRESGCTAVHYNAAYEPWRAESDERVSEALRARGVAAVRLRRSLCSAQTPTLALGPDPTSSPDPTLTRTRTRTRCATEAIP